jgi:GH24 family phage-related lysozyme (muramidase)
MAGLRLPGPLCRYLGAREIDVGTLCLHQTSVPGLVPPQPPPKARKFVGPPAPYGPPAPSAPAANTEPNAGMTASDNAALFIASFEAMAFICPDGKVRAYQDGGCGKGNWTVGVGEMSGRDKDSVFDSVDAAYESFVSKVKGEYSQRVTRALRVKEVTRKLQQYEFDALVDLAYQKGNCLALAELIADGAEIRESDFVGQTSEGHAHRRKREYALFSGQSVTVMGYTEFHRLDNTNGGYCPIAGKAGYTKVKSTTEHVLTY